MDEFEARLNHLLVNVFSQILRFEEASVKSRLGSAVTVTEAHILDVIGRQSGNITASEIASYMHITVPTITVALKKLETKGLIAKTPCAADGRRFIIDLTSLGKKICRMHNLFHRKMVREMSGDLSEEEKSVLLSGVKKLCDYFGSLPGKKAVV